MRVLIFGGTTEARDMAVACHEAGDNVLVSVATEAGKEHMPSTIETVVGRLMVSEMVELAKTYNAERIIDATHPFAQLAHANIRACADQLGCPLERVERMSDRDADFSGEVLWARDAQTAAELLREMKGNVLLTTGGNTVGVYAKAVVANRLFIRILPMESSLQRCAEAGVPMSHICAMQGPFSSAMNDALYAMWDIDILVTKDSGAVGGVREKVEPALKRGIKVIVIERPNVEG